MTYKVVRATARIKKSATQVMMKTVSQATEQNQMLDQINLSAVNFSIGLIAIVSRNKICSSETLLDWIFSPR